MNAPANPQAKQHIGQILIDQGILTEDQLRIALRGNRVSPQAAESRLKTLLASDPGAHVLNFTLGNQLAQQGRWAEAQQEYFKAYAGDPENADFAYNLAVSLDHLRQPRLARDYYLRAVSLAEKRGATFDPAVVRTRAAQLGN